MRTIFCDAADWGGAEEYAEVTDFLDGLLARLNLGNHGVKS